MTNSQARHIRPDLLRRTARETRGIVSLAIPIVFGMVSGVLMVMIDTAMIASLGPEVVAAAALATSAFIIVNSALIGFTSVIGVQVAQAVGGRDPDAARIAFAAGVAVTLGLSLLIVAAMLVARPLFESIAPSRAVFNHLWPYWMSLALAAIPHALLTLMRAVYNAIDRPWHAVGFTLLGVLLNIPLNALLIHGTAGIEGGGLTGAGIASAIAKLAALAALIVHFRHARSLRVYRGWARFTRRDAASLLREGMPVALGSVSEGGAYAATGMLMAALGTVALAAHQVVHSVGVIFYMVPIGLMIAVSVRTGLIVGARQTERLLPLWLAGLFIVLIWSAGTLLFILAARDWLGQALSPGKDVRQLARGMFLAMVFIQCADGLQSISLGALRGLSDNLIPNLATISIYWGVALPLGYAIGFVLGYGALGVLVGYGLGVLVATLYLQARLFRITRRFVRARDRTS